MTDLHPISEFLERHAPFDALPRAELEHLAAHLQIEYFRRDAWVFTADTGCDRLYIVRSGALRECNNRGELVNEYAEGDAVGGEQQRARRAPGEGATPFSSLRAVADTLVYTLSEERFAELCRENPSIALFFTARAAERLRAVTRPPSGPGAELPLWSQPVGSLLTRPALSVSRETSIRQAAVLMTQAHVSSVFITGGDRFGILTDHDLRKRVIGEGRSFDDPVHSVMSSPVVSVDVECPMLDAMMEMLNRDVHHLAVRHGGEIVGAVAVTDLAQTLAANPVMVMRQVRRQTSVPSLAHVARQRSDVMLQLLASGARARDVHRVMTRIGDAVNQRLIELAWLELEATCSEPSGQYAWVAFGSQARDEHGLGSDQDNGLVLSDSMDAGDGRLRELAERVCEGLDACGYPRCHGEIMASNHQWRQPVRVWREYFTKWIRSPSMEAVMRGSIFFDMRAVSGNSALVDELLEHIAEELKAQPLFIAHLARDALSRRPPLGLFGRFVLEHNGEHVSGLDMKQRGIVPIVDLARVYALEAACRAPNTRERLRCAAQKGVLSQAGSGELLDALELISALRLQHQARRLAAGRSADHQLDPRELSSNERKHLRDAFSVVKALQDSLQHSHQLANVSA